MKKLLLLVIILFRFSPLFAQSLSDSIVVTKSLGTVFKQNNKKLTPRNLLAITQANPEAYKEMQVAKSNFTVGNILGTAGGFLIGYPLGSAIAGGKPNWTLVGIGSGLAAVSLPFTGAYTKHAKKAVRIYNQDNRTTGINPVKLEWSVIGSGLGMNITF